MKNNISVYFAVFLLSIGIWFYVTMSREYIYEVALPVTVLTNNTNNQSTNIVDSMITFKLKGEGWKLLSLYFYHNNTININLGDDTTKRYLDLYDYFSQNDILGPKLQLISVYPRVLKIRIEKIITKKVAIIPNYSLTTKEGYVLASEPKVTPESVVVKGAESVLTKLSKVKTQKIVLNNVMENHLENTDIVFPRGVKSDITNVNVEFDVQQLVDLEIKNIPITVNNYTKFFQVTLIPENVDVKIRGGIHNVANLKSKIQAYVNLEDLLNDTTSYIIPSFNLPENIKIIEVNPPKIRYLIRKN